MFSDLSLIDILVLLIFPAAMAFAAASDLFTMRISNKVSLLLVVGFAVLAPFVGFDFPMLAEHVLVGGLVLALGFTCFSFGWMGGGDAKIAAATALWFGGFHSLVFLLNAAVMGGALTLLLVFARRMPLPAMVADVDWIQRLYNNANGIPYGIALSASALMVYPETLWMAYVLS